MSHRDDSRRHVRPGLRLWLQDAGAPVFGMGICRLLHGVESTGSLRRAATDMDMAYSKAWRIVQRAEEHLGFALIARRVGGASGGGSVLTEEGRELVKAFEQFADRVQATVDALYDETLRERLGPGTRSGSIRPMRSRPPATGVGRYPCSRIATHSGLGGAPRGTGPRPPLRRRKAREIDP